MERLGSEHPGTVNLTSLVLHFKPQYISFVALFLQNAVEF